MLLRNDAAATHHTTKRFIFNGSEPSDRLVEDALHEFGHIKDPGHTREFRRLVNQMRVRCGFKPDWRGPISRI